MEIAILAVLALIIIGILYIQHTHSIHDNIAADPLVEAEVYLIYGEKKRAIQILSSALEDEPNRQDIASKLRELKHT